MAKRPSTRSSERLTLREAWDDVGWVYATFSSLVGGPSVLALVQMIFEYRLIDALQWIVDGYNDITAALSAYVEPVLAPVIAWLNQTFDWRLNLMPHWRPVFLLTLIFVSAMVRRGAAVTLIKWLSPVVAGAAALIGAAIAGCIRLDASWGGQGLIAMAPMLTVLLGMSIVVHANGLLTKKRLPTARGCMINVVVIAIIAGVAFLLGAGAAFTPFPGAGIVALGAVVMALGVFLAVTGFKTNNVFDTRTALIILGGFFTAGLILAADALIKLLT